MTNKCISISKIHSTSLNKGMKLDCGLLIYVIKQLITETNQNI